MTACILLALRLFAVPFRLAVYLARAVVLAASADPEASTAFWTIVVAVFATWLAVRLVRAAARHANATRVRRDVDEFEQIIRHSWPDAPVDCEMPETVRIQPHAAPPPPRRPSRRRRMPSVRIPRRRARHTTSTSDRSSRS